MTQITTAQANKILNAGLFTEHTTNNSLTNILTDAAAPTSFDKTKADSRKQTGEGAPVVRINSLKKESGDEVEMDLFFRLKGQPAIGDEELDGFMESIAKTGWKIKIDQVRKGVASGGRMTRQRTKHDLISIAKAMMGPWWSDYLDQLTLIHLSGARGDTNRADWIIPPENNPRFERMMVNEVTPPTYDRHFFGGDATSFESIESSDIMTLDTVDNLRLELDEMAFPPQPIRYHKDKAKMDNPFHILGVSPRQWDNFSRANNREFSKMQADAVARSKWFDHPVFMGDVAMWKGILIKKMKYAIQFNTGSTVTTCQNNVAATTTQVTAGTNIHRALLLGGQALGYAMGMSGDPMQGGSYLTINTETKDHKNKKEHSIAAMFGLKKVRFTGSDGRMNDFGVIGVDTAVS